MESAEGREEGRLRGMVGVEGEVEGGSLGAGRTEEGKGERWTRPGRRYKIWDRLPFPWLIVLDSNPRTKSPVHLVT